MRKATFVYLASYLLVGGIGLALFPGPVLKLFFAASDYGDVMPRVVGMFMIVLGYLIANFIRNKDYRYYVQTIVARTFIVVFLGSLYFVTDDPLFIVLNIIVLVGLVPSMYVYFTTES